MVYKGGCMLRTFSYLVIAVFFSIPVFALDPNLESYKRAGECSQMTSAKNCVYCPQKKKFIALSQSSKFEATAVQTTEDVTESESMEKEGHR